MRNVLIAVNCLLAFFCCIAAVRLCLPSREVVEAVKPVKRVPKAMQTVRKTAPGVPELQIPRTSDEQVKAILAANIFNPERSPNSGMRGGNRNATLTLVGTFKVGKTEGAIIKIKGLNNQNRFMSMGGMFGMPGMMPPPPPPGMDGGIPMPHNGGNSGSNAVRGRGGMMAGTGGGRRRFSSMFQPQQSMNSNSNNSSTGIKQYVKIGETLSSGHTLIEVTRFKAVLTRGGTKTELNLEDPSKNQIRYSATRRVNANQQFMQNSLNAQRQMMQMMQNMQRGMNMSNMMMDRMNRNMQNSGSGGRGGGRR